MITCLCFAEVLAKTLHKNNQNVLENIKQQEIIKDSVVQPPNPVPPNSNEKSLEIAQIPKEQILNDIPPIINNKKNEQSPSKIIESHPKDVKAKLNEVKLDNSDSNLEEKRGKVKEDNIKDSKHSEEDKRHIIKQQKLIETMKQHGEEQNKLMNEILDDMIKAKQEIQENKNELETKNLKIVAESIKEDEDAKKIAVESIKQIANIAIQSIGGVTEKPNGPDTDVKKSEQLEKLTNDAVQEIAKKAVETIEAIQEIKEKPEKQALKIENNPLQGNHIEELKQQIDQKQMPYIPPVQQLIQNNVRPAPLQNSIEIQNKQDVLKLNVSDQIVPKAENVPLQNVINEIKPDLSKSVPNQQIIKTDVEAAPLVPNNNNLNLPKKENYVNEPKSLQNENTNVENIVKPNIQNVPLPLVINAQDKNEINKKPESAVNSANIKSASDAKMNNVIPDSVNKIKPIVSRQKREIIDCTEKVTLQQENKEVCKNLINNNPKITNHLPKTGMNDPNIVDKEAGKINNLPLVDLNDLALTKKLPMDLNIVEYIGRSLKNYDEFKDR